MRKKFAYLGRTREDYIDADVRRLRASRNTIRKELDKLLADIAEFVVYADRGTLDDAELYWLNVEAHEQAAELGNAIANEARRIPRRRWAEVVS